MNNRGLDLLFDVANILAACLAAHNNQPGLLTFNVLVLWWRHQR